MDKEAIAANNESLSEYIQNWLKIEEIKPCNEAEFIDHFIVFVDTLDDERDVSFNGEGAYFGKRVTIAYNSGVWVGDPILNFEEAYSRDKLVIYNGRNEGFWTPEYVSMGSDDPRFDEMMKVVVRLLNNVFGLSDLAQQQVTS